MRRALLAQVLSRSWVCTVYSCSAPTTSSGTTVPQLPAVVFLDFGSSVFGTSDATHLSFFDLALMGGMPNLRCLAPACREEYEAMLDWAMAQDARPVVIRVPGNGVESRPGLVCGDDRLSFDTPHYQVVREGEDVAVLALGSFFGLGERVCDALMGEGLSPTLVNPRFATELDEDTLNEIAAAHTVVVTLEDGVLEGGWGEKVARYLGGTDSRVLCYGVSKGFPDRYDVDELLAENGVTVEASLPMYGACCPRMRGRSAKSGGCRARKRDDPAKKKPSWCLLQLRVFGA